MPDGVYAIDRRLGVYGHTLDIKVLFFGALRAARDLLSEDHHLRGAVTIPTLVPEGRGYFIGHLGPARMDFRFFSNCNLLSVPFALPFDQELEDAIVDRADDPDQECVQSMPGDRDRVASRRAGPAGR